MISADYRGYNALVVVNSLASRAICPPDGLTIIIVSSRGAVMTHVTGIEDVVHSPYKPASRRARPLAWSIGLMILAATHGWAQEKPGTVSGVVIDPAGAPIANVEVT